MTKNPIPDLPGVVEAVDELDALMAAAREEIDAELRLIDEAMPELEALKQWGEDELAGLHNTSTPD